MLTKAPKVEISFREVYSFPSTNYGAFGLFRYPAKFIPQVVLYILREYAEPQDTIFDPFAGYGTVGFASKITGNRYELWDLNPVLELIHRAVLVELGSEKDIAKLIDNVIVELKKDRGYFYPDWSNLGYWFPEEFLELLGKVWFNAHATDIPQKPALLLALLKVTRYFSYSDEKVYKLYKSKRAKSKVQALLSTDYKSSFYSILRKELLNTFTKLFEFRKLKPKNVDFSIKTGIDALSQDLDREVDILITSPPYLQAQEYIRSTKLELFWLGYSESFIKNLSSKEIPYRKDVPDVSVQSEIYESIRTMISSRKLVSMYERYFKSIIHVLERLSRKVRKKMFVFVGPVQVENIKVPIDDIIAEHFISLGWKHEKTYVDKVKSRAMFNTRDAINPASGRKNTRMETELLVVLNR